MANGRGRDRQREVCWRRVVREQRGSGLTIRDFCRQSKLRESAFYFWRGELERRDCARRQAEPEGRQQQGRGSRCPRPIVAPAFVPVQVAQEIPPPAPGRLEIALTGGRRVHVIPPVDRQALADVLAVLEGRAC